MPEPVTAAITSYLYVAGASWATATAVASAIYYAAIIAASAAYGQHRKRVAARDARDAYNAGLKDRLVMTDIFSGPRSRIYGRCRNVDGVVFRATRGEHDQIYTLVVALSGHELDAIEQVWIGDAPVGLDADGYVAGYKWAKVELQDTVETFDLPAGPFAVTLAEHPNFGAVTALVAEGEGTENFVGFPVAVTVTGTTVTGTLAEPRTVRCYYQVYKTTPRVRVRKFLGAPGQDLSPILTDYFPTLCTAADKFAVGGLLLVDLEYDTDVFPGGVPAFSAVVRGAKVLDRRTGVTAWTRNPALIADDWVRYLYGGRLPSDALVADDITAAANACDVAHTFTDSAGASTTGPVYTCDIAIRLDGRAAPARALDDIVNSMAGRWGWYGGALTLRAGSWRAPTITIDESWISDGEAIQIVPEPASDDAVNVMTATFADAAQGYVAVPAPPLRVESWIAADGRELPDDITLGGVTDHWRAASVQGVMLRERREGLTLSLPLNLRGLQLKPFSVVYVSLPILGFTLKRFEILDWRFSMTGGVVVLVKETDPSIFTPDPVFPAYYWTPNSQLPDPKQVPAVTGLTCASGPGELLWQNDGTIVSRIHFTWGVVPAPSVKQGGRIQVAYRRADRPESDGWETVDAAGDATGAFSGAVQDGAAYVAKVRARTALVTGQWSSYASVIVAGKAALPSAVTGLVGTKAVGLIAWAWAPCLDSDYAETELRIGPSWASATVAFRSRASQWMQQPTAPGTYTVRARHIDTSGNYSASETVASVVVVLADLPVSAVALAAAQLAAAEAQADADAANTAVAAIVSDSVLSRGEKPETILKWNVLSGEQVGIDAQATAYGITTEKDAYDAAVAALASHLNGLTPLWSDTGADTPIVGATFRAKWQDAYLARQTLLDKIASLANNRLVGAHNMLWGGQNGPASAGPGVYGNALATLKDGAGNPYGLQPGETLTLSADVWQDAASAAAGQTATVYLYCARADNAWTVTAAISTTGQFATRLSSQVTLPSASDMVTVAVGLWHQGGGGNPPSTGTVFADRIQVERGTTATQYRPGSQPGATVGAPAGTMVGGTLAQNVESIAGAQAKANAAAAAAQSAAQTYAEAQANQARVNAQAYADGVVDAEEARAIADATAKAEAARVAAVNAAAADATAKANLAATTATWTGVSGRPSDDAIRNNLIDVGWWAAADAAIPWGQNFAFNRMMGTSEAGVPGPRGGSDVLWYAGNDTGSSAGAAGGWVTTSVADLNPAKTYRFVVPIYRIDGSGSSYWGPGDGRVCDLNTSTPNGNPYFASGGLTAGRWHLFVGYLFPAGSVGNTHGGAGIYDCTTGALVAGGFNYNQRAGYTDPYHRAYQYYASLGAHQVFGRPMVNLVDGAEPSLREYFEAGAVLNSALLPIETEDIALGAVNYTVTFADAAGVYINPSY